MLDKIRHLLKTKILLFLVPIIIFFSLGWGYIGHSIINYNTILTALPEMDFFEFWADSLAAHGSDADDRKSIDPDEGPKHYIDIDNYPEFIATGTIPQNFDSIVALHGYSFVIEQGILPWAILNTADSLQAAFENNNLHKAMLLAADLGHYIADAHMPLHITRNYNGQYTDQYGVHSRYESGLIQRVQDQIIYSGDSLLYIDNLPDYIFNMIYDNYLYVDSVLAADAAAKAFAGNTNSTAYYNKFWELSKNFTIELFKKASYRLTCVIYTAWINGGGSSTGISENNNSLLSDFNLFQNYPNPFNPTTTTIKFALPVKTNLIIAVYNLLGEKLAEVFNGELSEGYHEVEFNAVNIPSGVYFYRIESEQFIAVKKMVLLR